MISFEFKIELNMDFEKIKWDKLSTLDLYWYKIFYKSV